MFKNLDNQFLKRLWVWSVLSSWGGFAIFLFIAMIAAWRVPLGEEPSILSNLWVVVALLSVPVFITTTPLLLALLRGNLKTKLYTSSITGSIGLFIISFFMSWLILIGVEVICKLLEVDALFYQSTNSPDNFFFKILANIFMGYLIGIVTFPLTFGVIFPFAIPIGCSIGVWAIIDEHNDISRKAWGLFMAGATFGWVLVAVTGFLLAKA